jgi:ADP-heptose:LPS heptosyltransferase
LAHADLLIAADTGVLHTACALGRPVVALFGPTSPALTGPLGHPDITAVIHHAESCPRVPCYRLHHPSHPGMASISVDEVFQAASGMLEGRSWKLETGR